MKIIGYQTKGNAVRFYLGSYDLKPKYRTSGTMTSTSTCSITSAITATLTASEPVYTTGKCVKASGIYPYADFVAGWKDVYVSWDKTVFTNPLANIEDLRAHNEPLVVVAESTYKDNIAGFDKYKGSKNAIRYYLDDELEPDEVGLPDDYPEKSLADQRLFLFL